MKGAFAFLCLLAAAGCSVGQSFDHPPEPGLERMTRQPKLQAYQAFDYFPDGRAMRPLPRGAVPTSSQADNPLLATGQDDHGYARDLPVPVDLALLRRGQDRFNVVCSTCHGPKGDGDSPVARKMPLVRPRSLHEEEVVSFPPGRLFGVISEGYGMMPSYAYQLLVQDRWSVVAYVKALQLSQHAELAKLPDWAQSEARKELR